MSPVSKRALLSALVALVSLNLVTAADVFQGCYSNYNNGTRALPFLVMSGSTMTPALCSKMANARLASAFGLEFGRECWLDPRRGSPANLTRFGASTACNMACAGDSTSTCGGRYAVDLYTTDLTTWNQTLEETAFQEVGCYRDSQNFRVMRKHLWDSPIMSLEMCAHIAYQENWPIFGLQYGRECWGSDDVTRAEQLGVLMANGSCNLPCSGNGTQTCGGAWAMQMYRFDAAPAIDLTHADATTDEPDEPDESDKSSTTNSTTSTANSTDVSTANSTDVSIANSTIPSLLVGGDNAGTSNSSAQAPNSSAGAANMRPQTGASGVATVSSVLLIVSLFAALTWM